MEKYLPTLQSCALFQDIASSDIPGLLACLGASLRTYKKQQQILSEGDPANRLGILLTGNAAIVSQDIYGNRSILASVQPGQLFAESFACSGVEACYNALKRKGKLDDTKFKFCIQSTE